MAGDGEVTKVASNRQWTTYFRRVFYVPNPALVTALNARLTRDDAAIIYLNGTEIWRDTNITTGTITNQTPALSALGGTNETNWLALSLPPSTLKLLVPGWNLPAAEVHQSGLTSSDISFDFALTGVAATSAPALTATRSGQQLHLTWPADAGFFCLYSATSLTPPVTWAVAADSGVLSNNQWRVTIPAATNGQRFYRLQAP